MAGTTARLNIGSTMRYGGTALRPGIAAPTAANSTDDGEDDPLATMIGEIVRDFQADGILITHQDEDGAPVILFADGACDAPQRQMERTLLVGASGDSGEWSGVDDQPDAAMLTTSLAAPGGAITVRTFFRRMGDTTRARARIASLRLQPLLQPFARLWWQRRRARSRERNLTAAINKTDIGVVLIDAHARPIFTNAAATALLAEGDGIRMHGAMLGGAALSDTLRLQAAVEHVSSGKTAGPAPVVALPRTGRRPLMVAVMKADDAPDEAHDGAAAVDHAAILYVFDPEQDLCALIAPACAFYGLSPTETRLTCLLADGMSLVEAATRLRVREATARSYLKQIFAKTDTNRQAELVWLMLKSTVRTRSERQADTATLV